MVDPALSSKYCADGELLVLLDVTLSQEMLDEGVAREIINKIQKLRKKVKVEVLLTNLKVLNLLLWTFPL